MSKKITTTSTISRCIFIFFIVLFHYVIVAIIIRPYNLKAQIAPSTFLTIISSNNRPQNQKPNPYEQIKTATVHPISREKRQIQTHVEKILYSEKSEPDKRENEHPRNSDDLSFDSLSQTLEQKKSHSNITSLNYLNRRHNLNIDATELKTEQTQAQQASTDVRSNSARLTVSEKFAVATGSLDCIFQSRLADGQIVREPGRWIVVPARSEGELKSLAKARFCVRLNQSNDQFGSDMTTISEGLKGKK